MWRCMVWYRITNDSEEPHAPFLRRVTIVPLLSFFWLLLSPIGSPRTMISPTHYALGKGSVCLMAYTVLLNPTASLITMISLWRWKRVNISYTVPHTPIAWLKAPSWTSLSIELPFFPSMAYSSTKKMEAAYSSETLTTTYQTAWHHILKNGNTHYLLLLIQSSTGQKNAS
jgi:hypothetical protein